VTAKLLVRRDDVRVFHASWAELLAILPYRDDGTKVDALIVDAPYSERTHAGHDDGSGSANRAAAWARTVDPAYARAKGTRAKVDHGTMRRTLTYAAWTDDDVSRFVEAWAPVTRGWFVSLTDHALAPAWERALAAAGRYVFAPIACVEPGSRVRLVGDGPSQWSTWAVVSRPSDGAWLEAWRGQRKARGLGCSLSGAYVVPPGQGDYRPGMRERDDVRVVGGKPLWLMERLVEDYSRPGDLVCDPCCGAGTTLEAALRTGRLAVGGDAMREHAELAAARVSRPVQRPLLGAAEAPRAEQRSLFAGVSDEGEAA